MIVRYAKEKDTKEIRSIWDYCFNDEEGFVNYYFKRKYDKKNTIVIEEENEIISSLQMNKYNIKLDDQLYDISYVVGVSTLPHKRGKGYMKHLMEKSLDEMYKNEEIVSILMPIDYRLYRKYGYENCYDILEYNIDVEECSKFDINGNLKKATIKDIEHLIQIYEKSLKDKNGYIKRDEQYFNDFFEEVQSENGYIFLHEKDNDFDGYIVYFIQNDAIVVREIMYTSVNALEGMLKFMYNHNTQTKKLTIYTFVDDYIKDILENPKQSQINIKPFMMGRVINVKKYFESISSEEKIDINIQIIDYNIPNNNKCFNIKNNISSLKVTQSNDADVVIDINTLSQLAFSYIDVDTAIFLNKIKINNEDKIAKLKSVFKSKKNYINEYV